MAKKKMLEDYLSDIQAKSQTQNGVDYRALMNQLDGKTYRTIEEYTPKGVERRVQSYKFDNQNRIDNINLKNSISPLDRAYAPVTYSKDSDNKYYSYKDVMDNSEFSSKYDANKTIPKMPIKKSESTFTELKDNTVKKNNNIPFLSDFVGGLAKVGNNLLGQIEKTQAEMFYNPVVAFPDGETKVKTAKQSMDNIKDEKAYIGKKYADKNKIIDDKYSTINENDSTLSKMGKGLAGSLPSMLTYTIPVVGQTLGSVNALEGGYNRAINQGLTHDKANLYGAKEAALDLWSMPNILKGKDTVMKTALNSGLTAGLEGALSEGSDLLFKDNEGNRLGANSFSEFAQNVGVNALTGLVGGTTADGVGRGITKVNNKFNKALNESLSELDEINLGKSVETGSILPTNKTLDSRDIKNAKLRNVVLENAYNEYNNAIKEIQDYVGHYKLTDDEIIGAMDDLGIDLFKLVDNIEKAEGKGLDVNNIREYNRLRKIVGLGEVDINNLVNSNTGIPYSKNFKKKDLDSDISPVNAPVKSETVKEQFAPMNVKNVSTDKLEGVKPIPKEKSYTVDDNGIERMNNKIEFTENKSTSIIDKVKNSYTRLVDTNNPLKKNASDKTYKLATNSKVTGGIVTNILDGGLTNRNGETIGKSVKELFSDIPKGEEKEFFEYMMQKHNIDRAREGKHISKDFESEKSIEVVAKWEKAYPHFKDKAKEITEWIDTFMQEWGVNSGIVNGDLYKQLRETYPSYIPTYRKFEDNEIASSFSDVSSKFVDLSTPIKSATGSDRDIVNPVESIIRMVDKTVKTAKYNEVGKSFVEDIINGKASGIARIIEGEIPTNRNDIVTVLIDGKKVGIEIDEKGVIDALENLYKNKDGDVTKAARYATNKFKSLITQYNPFFSVFNAFRDLQNYMINTVEGNPLKALYSLGESFVDIAKDRDDFKRYKAVGGGGGNQVASNKIPKVAKDMLKGNDKKVINPSKLNPLNWIDSFNNTVENTPRLAEFKNSLRKGNDVDSALYDSLDVTTNFSKNGDISKKLDAYNPFLNASVQGLDKLGRQLKNHPIQTLARGGAYITAPTMILNAINKDEENYQDLSNRNKDTYYNIPMGDGTFFKLPKSRDYGTIFSSLPERLIRQSEGDPNAFKDFDNTIIDNLAPVNPLDSNILAPIYNLSRNKDFADRTIVPQSLQDRLPKDQYDENTSEIGKFIGDKLNVSPKQVDYLIDAYSGVIGDVILPATTNVDSVGEATKNVIEKIVTNKFIGDPLYSNQSSQDFYDNKDEITSLYNSGLDMSKDSDKWKRQNQDLVDFYKEYNSISKDISDLTKKIKQTKNEDEIRKYKTEQLKLYKKINSDYEKYKASK